jgi:hypothetical protein
MPQPVRRKGDGIRAMPHRVRRKGDTIRIMPQPVRRKGRGDPRHALPDETVAGSSRALTTLGEAK